MLNAREFIEAKKAEYTNIGIKGALEELLDYHVTHGQDDPLIYSRLSVLSLMIYMTEVFIKLLNVFHSDEGLADEELWSDYLGPS
jgi:hypothetical protein